jgi:UDP-N-acetylmuramyl pentapeptide phosphotransferase/UDP-N-acetylglucosamine-1-phosphate transferase
LSSGRVSPVPKRKLGRVTVPSVWWAIYAHKALATITPENAYTTIDGVDGLHTRSVVASFISAHGYDHYGQMVEYLRMNGVVPPGSK